MTLHARLNRQLRRTGLTADAAPTHEQWGEFLARLSGMYADLDQERYLLERSMSISSDEMRALHESLGESATEQSVLRHVATEVARGMEGQELFDLLSREVARLLRAEAGRVIRFDGATAAIVGVWGASGRLGRAGLVADTFALHRGMATAVARDTGRPARVAYFAGLGGAHMAALARRGFLGAVAAPIRIDGRMWGAVSALTTRPDGLPQGSENRLVAFAELVAVAVANGEVRQALARRALTDPLTGLVNHREFHDRLAAEVARARRHQRPLSVVMIDIDRFKRLNDTFGHQVGDAVLVEVARRLQSVTRRGEVVGRLGGEEFGWIVPETGLDGAVAAAERARREIASGWFPTVGKVTVSAGVAELGLGVGAMELVAAADTALYAAKRGGRDTVVPFSATLAAGLGTDDQATREERDARMGALLLTARAADARKDPSGRHGEVVADVAAAVARELGWGADDVRDLREAALLHDIGDATVPADVLGRRGALTDAERAEVREHAARGAEMTAEVLDERQRGWIRHHHERWDGAGYPDGLAGDAIPEGARILCLASVWSAMTGSRPYRTALAGGEALEEAVRQGGSHFWPPAVEALVRVAVRGELAAAAPGAELVSSA